MKQLYIHSAVAISAQDTFDYTGKLYKVQQPIGGKLKAMHLNHRDYILPAELRRMAPASKMGLVR